MNKLLMMIGAAAVVAGAYADTVEINGVTWTFTASGSNVTLGGGTSSTQAMPTATALDAADIPWTFTKDGTNYTVTAIATYAFESCSNLTGTLTIPASVTSMGDRAFQRTGISGVASVGGITTIPLYAFNEAKSLSSFTADISNVTKITYGAFQGAEQLAGGFYVPGNTLVGGKRLFRNSKLRVILFGPNTTAEKHTATEDYGMLDRVTGCKVFVPAKLEWNGLDVDGIDTDVIWYGVTTNLNLSVDDVHGVITATPTDEAALVKVLESAPLFKTNFGWNTRINVTNTIEVAAGTITAAMLNAVEFNTMLLTFKVNTQAQLNSVLAAVPASTYPLLAIDASDAREELILPQGREIYVRVSGDGKQGKYRPKINGLIISFF